MSYQVLARKWRPQNFAAMVGQGHVLKALSNAMEQGRLHHAYLFAGTRGVGKTTLARILARCLNCEQGVTANPCGSCNACVEITEGRFIDLIEVDAASRTKVEDTRELLENVQYTPTGGRYKIYLIDEVHMLSNHSFNALLKTLEEPPPHVKFLFATTHPQKLPPTILSRCLQFNLKSLSVEKIAEYLKYVLEQESIKAESDALWRIATAANGSMRDALSITDQAVAFSGGDITSDHVAEMLGLIDQQVVRQLCEALIRHQAEQAFAVLDGYAEASPDYATLIDELMSLAHAIAMEQMSSSTSFTGAKSDREWLQQLAAATTAEDVQLIYQAALQAKRDLPYAPDGRTCAEMLCLRVLAFSIPDGEACGRAEESSDIQAGLVASEKLGDAKKKPDVAQTPEMNQGDAVCRSDKPGLISVPGEQEAVTIEGQKVDAVSAEKTARAGNQMASTGAARQSLSPIDTHQSENDSSLSDAPALTCLDKANWSQIAPALPLNGVARSIVAHCVLGEVNDQSLTLLLDSDNASLYSEEYTKRIEDGLGIYFGQSVGVKISVVELDDDQETPSMYRQRLKQAAYDEAMQEISADANVRLLIDEFGGEIDRQSVRKLTSD